MKSPRRAAVSILRAWTKGHAYAENLIERHASRNDLSSADRALLNAIVLGVLRNLRLLDHWISQLRKGKLDDETRDILRVGLCQLLILELPDHAAVFETVELGKSGARGLINAVMRRAAATKKKLFDLEGVPPETCYSHPEWLFKRWKKAYGKEEAIELMAFNNHPAPTIARLNPLVASDFQAPESDLPDGFFQIEGPIPNHLLASGAIYIQDPATRHSVDLLDPRPGERVLDACAAPGGKAFLIAAAQGGGKDLVCTDSNEKRLPRLRENLERLQIKDAEIDCHDWSTPGPGKWHGAFDAILLDVPCSNTGVFRRRVDVRWRLKPADITALTKLQRQIIENALPCLKPGGRLVYSTCSVEAEENAALIDAVLADHPELSLEDTRQALPQRDGTDGAFAACLRLA
ncbi:16S rRNA (cytosine(967)-C(5))-methyltransferase RsmB [Luteolibacter arcticus]|uniref:16S rRNA (cytosine(967)-C(5))-methyltransferase n=1 Tax=Luteolibacter arcticus TaxID=1581411 RepID=A0ABT3GQZ7_9BACT|nr:16S rRNA (cytosine(967)-C(5))-methyltransferase RsmB [Luteolibacter arcticus]MCW1925948.1 16S rRNA (cytosine(967)-C(5))-methyltransferase RsmB [Luteolibacter arcticus]